jgi:CheY-like chemotaxis protein
MPLGTPAQPLELLLVEDSPTDVLMARAAFEDATLLHRLHVVENAEQALAFIHHEHRYADTPRPN